MTCFRRERLCCTAATLDQGIPALVASYGKRFQTAFPFPSDYQAEKRDSLEAFSKAITSNLVGGVGYFYGTSIVNRKFSYEWDEEDEAQASDDGESGARLTEPKALLTATPSRSFFPRGFYWYTSSHAYTAVHNRLVIQGRGVPSVAHWCMG